MANDIFRQSGFVEPKKSITHLFGGYDHRNASTFFSRNTDEQGLVFFTRPRMNLSYDNIRNDRRFLPLTTENSSSMFRAIRQILDPVGSQVDAEGYDSELFDGSHAFIPLLTNTLISLSGFPDPTVETYTATEGMRKETYGFTDDIADINNAFDLTATFANIPGDPISQFFYYWMLYQSNVYTGSMVPYPDMIIENEIDYQTRIWRLVLDPSRQFVRKIGCANACWPVSSPLGAVFNYTRESVYNEDNTQVSIPFRCIGAEYLDPLLIEEFNKTVQAFDPEDDVTLYPHEAEELNLFGYPQIDVDTLELQWKVSKAIYNEFFPPPDIDFSNNRTGREGVNV